MILRLNVSNVCNYNCKNCHVFSLNQNLITKKFMDYSVMSGMVEFYLKQIHTFDFGKCDISFYGGEALLNKEIFTLIKNYNKNKYNIKISWIINTNGSLINDEMVEKFKKYNIEIHISCDGGETVHNKHRLDHNGDGTFYNAIKALKLLEKNNIRRQINTFVMPENIDHLREIVDIAKKYSVSKVYLDFLYSQKDNLPEDKIVNKYIDVFQYGRKHKIEVDGPWGDVIRNWANNNKFFHHKILVPWIIAEADETFYFSAYPLSKKKRIALNKADSVFNSSVLRKFQLSVEKYYVNKCSGCFLRNYCKGKMILDWQFHTECENGYEKICSINRKVIKKIAKIKNYSLNNTIKTVHVALSYFCNRDCHYCYAKGMDAEYNGNLSKEDFLNLLDWLEKNNIKQFDFIGGEPSLHPEIGDFIRIAKERGFRIGMFTNALFPKSTASDLKDLDYFVVNYNQEAIYTKAEWEKLNQNLQLLSAFKGSIDIACNVSEEIDSISHILDLKNKKQIEINRIQMHLIGPNAFKLNDYIKEEGLLKQKDKMIVFIDELEKHGIEVAVTRPVPKCAFTEEELKHLGKKVYFTCSSGQSIVLVNPDLSVFPCTSVFFKGPKITDFIDIVDYQDYYKEVLDNSRRNNPRYKKCLDCEDFVVNCQGGCINEGLKPFQVVIKDKYLINSQIDLGSFEVETRKVIAGLEKYFGKLSQRVAIYLLKNRKEFDQYIGKNNWPEWVRGVSSAEKGKRLNYFQIGNSTKDLNHELTHSFIDDKNINILPFWFKEGVCEFIQDGDSGDKVLKQLLKSKKMFDFEEKNSENCAEILKIDNSSRNNNIAYKQSQSFISFLVKEFGWEIVLSFIIKKHKNFYSHFQKLTHKEFSQVVKEWKKQFTV